MKKTISLILGMFLILLSGCGKSSKLIRPTDSAETQETTRKEVKTQSDESTEKKEETIEQKPATNSWITKELIAIAIGTAIGAYALYKFMDWVQNVNYEIPKKKVEGDNIQGIDSTPNSPSSQIPQQTVDEFNQHIADAEPEELQIEEDPFVQNHPSPSTTQEGEGDFTDTEEHVLISEGNGMNYDEWNEGWPTNFHSKNVKAQAGKPTRYVAANGRVYKAGKDPISLGKKALNTGN